MSAYDFWRTMETSVNAFGNAYALIDAPITGRKRWKDTRYIPGEESADEGICRRYWAALRKEPCLV